MYTTQFSETYELLDSAIYSAATTEQNLPSVGFVNAGGYHRLAVVLISSVVGTNLNADVEMSTDNAGTLVRTLKSMTQTTEDINHVVFEIQTEELFYNGVNYPFVRVETTPSGAATYTVLIFGINPRFAPVSTAEWDEIVV